MTLPKRIHQGLDEFCLLYAGILGEAICFQAVPTANGRAFKSTRPVHTDEALTSTGSAI